MPADSGCIVPAFCLTCEGDTVEINFDEFVFDLLAYAKTKTQSLVGEIRQEAAPDLRHLIEDYLRNMGYF